MDNLLKYSQIAYDANCLIYYCMHCEIQDAGTTIRVIFPDFTDKIRKITDGLADKKKVIKTIEIVYDEIARSDRAGLVVEDLINREDIRAQLKLKRGQKFPALIKLRIIKSLDKKIRGLKGKAWFYIIPFTASLEYLSKVKTFYQSLSTDPRMLRLLTIKKRSVCYPSEQDIHLTGFSVDQSIPILTNDRDLTDFKDDLLSKGLSHNIVPLADVIV